MHNFTIIGTPLKHTLSPIMHNAAFKYLDLDWSYGKSEIFNSKDLESFLEEAKVKLIGFNVTLPYKSEIINGIDEISEEASLANSVNTVLVKDKKLYGYTTDGYGFKKAIESAFEIECQSSSFVFIGFGGAASAAVIHLLLNNTKDITIFNRTLTRCQDFIKNLQKLFPKSNINLYQLSEILNVKNSLSKKSIIVQATSLGLKKDDPLSVPLDFIESTYSIFDMIYRETKLLEESKKRGCKTRNGLDMLLYQGVKAFEIWTNRKAPIEIMRNALFNRNEEQI